MNLLKELKCPHCGSERLLPFPHEVKCWDCLRVLEFGRVARWRLKRHMKKEGS